MAEEKGNGNGHHIIIPWRFFLSFFFFFSICLCFSLAHSHNPHICFYFLLLPFYSTYSGISQSTLSSFMTFSIFFLDNLTLVSQVPSGCVWLVFDQTFKQILGLFGSWNRYLTFKRIHPTEKLVGSLETIPTGKCCLVKWNVKTNIFKFIQSSWVFINIVFNVSENPEFCGFSFQVILIAIWYIDMVLVWVLSFWFYVWWIYVVLEFGW